MSELGAEIAIDLPFDAAIEAVTQALADNGFGVISRVDMDKAFREKLGADFRRYAILGACNPKLALKAVTARPEVGLLLPCNVTVEARGDGALVRIIDAGNMMQAAGLGEEPAIAELAADAGERLSRVAEALRAL
ncbi:DUF302 domain-containing protein [Sandaracinobacteroides sp. A072]|uniref:DUF302 domain-containing protein n=1 Tax=Sandaracinobacteroides sp. A072 TaxID=3461146 RepID=UPI0040435CC7